MNTEKILEMDRLSPAEMLELSQLITLRSNHDKDLCVFERINENKVTDLQNALMDSLIEMMSSGATGAKSLETIKNKQKSAQEAKAKDQEDKSTRRRNWQERTDLCNKFRQELLSMLLIALPKQGIPPASGEPSKVQPKRSFWRGGGTSNPYAVEEIDQ